LEEREAQKRAKSDGSGGQITPTDAVFYSGDALKALQGLRMKDGRSLKEWSLTLDQVVWASTDHKGGKLLTFQYRPEATQDGSEGNASIIVAFFAYGGEIYWIEGERSSEVVEMFSGLAGLMRSSDASGLEIDHDKIFQ
jgi:hypothetical protein